MALSRLNKTVKLLQFPFMFGRKCLNNLIKSGSSMIDETRQGQPARSMSTTSNMPVKLTKENINDFMDSYDTMLTDCDGVFWTCDQRHHFRGISETIAALRELGTKVIFVSNNSLYDRKTYIDKFEKYSGFNADEKDMYVVTYAAAAYLKEELSVRKCYLLGTQGFRNEIEAFGIKPFGFGPDPDTPTFDPEELMNMTFELDIRAVVVGYDAHFHHNKLVKAASYLRHPEVHFIATNDKEMRVNLGDFQRQPVTGSFVTAVAAASGRQPVVIGKPNGYMLNCILKNHPFIDLDRTVMVGDSLVTDIGFAKTIGVPSLLVLSGASSMEDLENLQQQNMHSMLPDYYTEKFSDLVELME